MSVPLNQDVILFLKHRLVRMFLTLTNK